VIEAVTGRPWSAVVKDRIFTPLGMSAAGTDIALMSSANAASAYSLSGGQLHIVPLDTIDNTLPAGGIIANVTDLAKWMIARLDSGAIPGGGGGRLFSAPQAAEMWSPQTILPIGDQPPPLAGLRPNFAAYGLGWSLRDYRGHKIVSHDGGLAGMTSRTLLVPDLKLGIVMLTNAEQPVYAPLAFELLDHFFGAPRIDWITRIHDVLDQGQARADSVQRAQATHRDSAAGPSLPPARYAGRYSDALYGDATITMEGDHLVLRFSHSPAFVGDLRHWQYDTFVAHWRTAHIEDAYVTFALQPDGSIGRFTMAAVSPLADFSFDYQDLLFVPAP
jgi:CubicO group peptidase (beta-lactamase class C family)